MLGRGIFLRGSYPGEGVIHGVIGGRFTIGVSFPGGFSVGVNNPCGEGGRGSGRTSKGLGLLRNSF